jgi:hypothetical protein
VSPRASDAENSACPVSSKLSVAGTVNAKIPPLATFGVNTNEVLAPPCVIPVNVIAGTTENDAPAPTVIAAVVLVPEVMAENEGEDDPPLVTASFQVN